MKFLITPDSYKGSMSAQEAAEVMESAIHKVLPEARCEILPMADGGEGTADCLRMCEAGEIVQCVVEDPLGKKIDSEFVWFQEQKKAVIEVAKACGIMLIRPEEKNPMEASSYGVGELINHAISMGCRQLILTLGGTVTNDGGCGMLSALGAKLTNGEGQEIERGGRGLMQIKNMDLSAPRQKMKDIEVIVLYDVKSPLLGPGGATRVFGAQKGATEEMLEELEQGMENYAARMNDAAGRKISDLAGAGAAGGIGCALYGICDAKYISGSQYLIESMNIEEKRKECDYVLTGEGSMDAQSLEGKVPVGIARIAKKYGKPVIAFVGMSKGESNQHYESGITAIFCILRKNDSIESILDSAEKNLEFAVENFARVIKMQGKQKV